MNTNLTHILFILDRSGSMSSMAGAAIEGFNRLLEEQRAEPGDARLTLVLFDDLYEVPCDDIPLAEVVPLDRETYVPRGSTALLDAICRGVDELGAKLAATPEEQRPGTVITAILTDGEENASTRHTWQDVQQRIRHQTDAYQWQFLFLGANQDAIATAALAGIAAHNASTFVADHAGSAATMDAITRKMKSIRKSRARYDMTAHEVQDLHAPMESIVDEEDRKKRKS